MKRLLLILIYFFVLISSPCYGQQDETLIDYREYRDYFEQTSDFGLTFARYKGRGYGVRYENYYINGLEFVSLENGTPMWGATVGYNTSRRNYQFFKGAEFDVRNSFVGGVGGAQYVTNKLSEDRIIQLNGSVGNRTYSYRLGGVYGNSWSNGLNVTLEGSRRWGRSLSIEGVWADAISLFANVNKVFDRKNELDFTLIFSPNKRANQRPSYQETFDLTSNTLYNPNWGYQNGKVRSDRSNSTFVPIATIKHSYKIDSSALLVTTLGAAVGMTSYSALNWQNAPNPNPNYYRNLPSFQTSEQAKQMLTQLWQNDKSVNQINYDAMYRVNSDDQAHYIQENRIAQVNRIVAQSVFRKQFNKSSFAVGIEAEYASELKYKKLNDLLGAQYWLDIDYFLEYDEDYREKTQNNVRDPNRHIGQGDQFGYKYSIRNFKVGGWGMYQYRLDNWLFSIAGSLKYGALSRTGYYEKENFLGDKSYGRSKIVNSLQYNVKAMAEYRLGNNFAAHVTATYMSLPQLPKNIFLDPNYRNKTVDNLGNESVFGFEFGVRYSSSNLKLYVGAYGTDISNGVEVSHFYDDVQAQYCDYVLSGVDKSFLGAELSFEVLLAQNFWLNAAFGIQRNRYVSNPKGVEYNQTTGAKIIEEEVFYKGLDIPLSPQIIASAGVSYRQYGWFASMSVNTAASTYAVLAPIRYTSRASLNSFEEDVIRKQEVLPAMLSLDVSGGKTFTFNNESRLGIYAGVSNITNSRFKTAAYQNSRLVSRGGEFSPMPSRYYYGLGVNFYLTITYTF